MRIGLLSMDYPPRMAGGTTVHTYQLAKALNEIGSEVHVVSASANAPSEEIREGIYIHRVKRPYTFFSSLRMRKLMKDLDIVHGHGTCSAGHLMLNKFPTVVKMHNTWLEEYNQYKQLKKNVKKRVDTSMLMYLYVLMDRYCAQMADHLICVSNIIQHEVEKYGIPMEKTTVIHNGIDISEFRADEDLKEKLDLAGIVVGYIGRLEPHKGVEYLIRAAKHIRAKFLIVGDGTDRKRLTEIATKMGLSDKIVFTGYVPHKDIWKYYNTADIIVYPTLYEPLGNVVLEAMASGKPIIASNVGGIPEIFEKDCGYLIKPSVEELTQRLNVLLEDENLRKKMGEKGRKSVKKYSWVEVARKTLQVCEKVLAK